MKPPNSLELDPSIEDLTDFWVDQLTGDEVTSKNARTDLDHFVQKELNDRPTDCFINQKKGSPLYLVEAAGFQTISPQTDKMAVVKVVKTGRYYAQQYITSARLTEPDSNEDLNLKPDIVSGNSNSVYVVRQQLFKQSDICEEAQIDSALQTLLKRDSQLSDEIDDENKDNMDQPLDSDLVQSQRVQVVQESLDKLANWLGQTENQLVGGLPETASDQLQRFMVIYDELEQNRSLVESLEQDGHYLGTLQQSWENAMIRASDKKNNLESALKEATEFHDTLQSFIDWLIEAEKSLGRVQPISLVMGTFLSQIEEHKLLLNEIGFQRQVMSSLDRKGTRLKYFSQKQDVILIKNLIISIQHRWRRIVSRAAKRTQALKKAFKFKEHYGLLNTFLDDVEKGFDDAALQLGKDTEKIKVVSNKKT